MRIDQLSYWGLMVGVGRGLSGVLEINSLLRRGWYTSAMIKRLHHRKYVLCPRHVAKGTLFDLPASNLQDMSRSLLTTVHI